MENQIQPSLEQNDQQRKLVNSQAEQIRESISKEIIRLKEIEELQKIAEKEKEELLNLAKDKIQNIADEINCFIGIRLNHKDLLTLIETALENPTLTLQIPYALYYNSLHNI